MAEPLWKVESGTDKQTVKPNEWTFVRFAKKTKFVVPEDGTWEWTIILRVEYPRIGTGSVLRGRLVRYPDTTKDETGHDDKNTFAWGGKVLHSHWSHTISCNPSMPIGFWVWHDGKKPIVLDGRQIKAKRLS